MYKILAGCPRCKQYPLRISHTRGPLEWLRELVTRKRPYRCVACGWRGWADETFDRRQRTDMKQALKARRADDRKPPQSDA